MNKMNRLGFLHTLIHYTSTQSLTHRHTCTHIHTTQGLAHNHSLTDTHVHTYTQHKDKLTTTHSQTHMYTHTYTTQGQAHNHSLTDTHVHTYTQHKDKLTTTHSQTHMYTHTHNTRTSSQPHTHRHTCTTAHSHLQWIELGAQLTDGVHVLLVALLHLQQFGRLDDRLELVHDPGFHKTVAATPFLQLANIVPGTERGGQHQSGRGGGGGRHCPSYIHFSGQCCLH